MKELLILISKWIEVYIHKESFLVIWNYQPDSVRAAEYRSLRGREDDVLKDDEYKFIGSWALLD